MHGGFVVRMALLTTALCGLSRASEAPVPCGAPAGTVVCLPGVEKKTRTHVSYCCRTRTVCLPFKPCKSGGCCPAAECGRPRQVRVLIKRIHKVERCEPACVPQHLPPAVECIVPVGSGEFPRPAR